jgi:predicted nucleotidyltransferase
MIAGLDFPDEWVQVVVETMARYAPGAEVWAYGSRVTGGNHAGSDLDLVLRNPADLRAEQPNLGRLMQAFSDGDLPILVDVYDWARMPAAFQREIEQAHVVLPLPGVAHPA